MADMKVIKEHIKTGKFKPFYLLYGEEDYLKRLYLKRLTSAILGDSDGMNYSLFEGRDIDPVMISEAASVLPFFADRRLIVVKNSGLFKTSSDLAELLDGMPDTTVIIFVEDEVDKRNKLYKLVKEQGTISEMNALDDNNLKLFAASLLEKEGKKITQSAASLIVEKCGSDMLAIQNEAEKLISYTLGRDIVTDSDVEAVITGQITGKLFNMIDAIGLKQKSQALELYYDLITLKEKPMTILYMVVRHMNLILQAKDLLERGKRADEIARLTGVQPFVAGKCISQSRNFTGDQLMQAIETGAELEEQIKTGRIAEKIGVEMLIITLSSK
jgi:DNA polymerase-3 subunit delta